MQRQTLSDQVTFLVDLKYPLSEHMVYAALERKSWVIFESILNGNIDRVNNDVLHAVLKMEDRELKLRFCKIMFQKNLVKNMDVECFQSCQDSAVFNSLMNNSLQKLDFCLKVALQWETHECLKKIRSAIRFSDNGKKLLSIAFYYAR